MTEKLKKVTLYTDGGSLGNPGPGGYGLFCCTPDTGRSCPAVFA